MTKFTIVQDDKHKLVTREFEAGYPRAKEQIFGHPQPEDDRKQFVLTVNTDDGSTGTILVDPAWGIYGHEWVWEDDNPFDVAGQQVDTLTVKVNVADVPAPIFTELFGKDGKRYLQWQQGTNKLINSTPTFPALWEQAGTSS